VSLLPILVLALASPPAGAVPPARVGAPAGVDHAYQLARFLNSDERADELWRYFLDALPAVLREAPETAALMREHPERVQNAMQDLWPQMTAELKGQLPILREKIAAVYRLKLSPEEARRLLDYYASPANVKLTREMLRRIDMARAVDGATGQVDRRETGAMTAQAYPVALALLSAAEREQVLAFKASPLAIKYATLRGDLAAARTAWMEEVLPVIWPRIEKAIDTAGQDGKFQ
jgi:hypothetical protein